MTIGIDEIATETQECSGYTMFSLPDAQVAKFATSAKQILDRHPELHSFHGKKYKQHFEPAYREFLQLIRETTGVSLQAGCANSLLARSALEELDGYADRLLSTSLSKARVPLNPALKIVKPYALRLFVLARDLRELGPRIVATIHMDESEELALLSTVTHSVGHVPIRAGLLLKAIYNTFAQKRYPNAPQLLDDGVHVMKDNKSFLIQAADVLGNFSMNHVFVRVGKGSKSREAKARLIEEVFGDLIDPIDLAGTITLRGEDLVLAPGLTNLRFFLGWIGVKPSPDHPPKGPLDKN
ncbi:MAG: hypothetical protein NTV94_10910 [Planctomycetota bacterium]|nr:hypothetical protein [Planctomycetota bacterium]